MVAGVLGLSCASPIFTHLGYVGLGLADGSSACLMLVLVPMTLASLLLGTMPGVLAGFLTGATFYLHARFLPLDYYEHTCMTPVTTIVMMTVCSLVLGSLFPLAVRGEKRRPLLVVLVCLLASSVYNAGCELALESEAFTAVTVAIQVVGDAFVMGLAAVLGLAAGERSSQEDAIAGLRVVFSSWLAALVLVAFLAIDAVSHQFISMSEYGEASTTIRYEVEFILDQVERMESYGGGQTARVAEAAETEASGTVTEVMMDNFFAGYSEDADGLMLVARDGVVIGADAERMRIGQSLKEALGEDIVAVVQRSAVDRTLEQVVYEGLSQGGELLNLALPGTEEQFAQLLVPQVGYLLAAQDGEYLVVMIRQSNTVFAARDDVKGWVFVSSVVLLLATLRLARQLLDRLVAGPIDATNEALARITGGDLEARVEADSTTEFVELSEGINETVKVLKGWIAEAESRMDAELATAKAIQESALPNVFPPYPDIQRFDIYATMNAAKEVGGDFYDFFLVGDDCGPDSGKLAFVMADVSGKGVPAALFMMKAKTQIHDYLASGMEVSEAIENANHQLCEGNEEGMFVTAWVGVLDYATGHIDYVNAGHNPPLLWERDSWEWVKGRSGLPLGIFDEMPYEAHTLDCEVGDQLLLYTDGVTEAFSLDEEQYGEDRLLKLAQECFALHPRELVDRVRANVATYAKGAEQSDDITILALEVGVPPEEKAQITLRADLDEIDRMFEFLRTELDRRLCSMRAQGQLLVAVEEMFVNVCKYAYEHADPSVDRYVRVTHSYSARPRSLTVEIIDDGEPFDPLAEPEFSPVDEAGDMLDGSFGGLGIMMAKKSVEEMRYERLGDSNVVTLVKRW